VPNGSLAQQVIAKGRQFFEKIAVRLLTWVGRLRKLRASQDDKPTRQRDGPV